MSVTFGTQIRGKWWRCCSSWVEWTEWHKGHISVVFCTVNWETILRDGNGRAVREQPHNQLKWDLFINHKKCIFVAWELTQTKRVYQWVERIAPLITALINVKRECMRIILAAIIEIEGHFVDVHTHIMVAWNHCETALATEQRDSNIDGRHSKTSWSLWRDEENK